MHSNNHYYGHDRAFARYAGITGTPPPIWGTLQHGWAPALAFPVTQRFLPLLPKFAWGRAHATAARERGWSRVIPIGAPFLYHDATVGPVGDPPPSPRSTIVYPHHSWEHDHAEFSHERYAAEVREREPGEVTVALYWLDATFPGVRATYEDAGFRVVVHGRRSDAAFLATQYEELRNHERVVGNGLGTALIYGAALGREVSVYGEPGHPDNPELGWTTRETFPALFDGRSLRGDEARSFGDEQLGREFVLPPDELRRLLGWGHLRAPLGRAVVPAVRAATRAVQWVTRRPAPVRD